MADRFPSPSFWRCLLGGRPVGRGGAPTGSGEADGDRGFRSLVEDSVHAILVHRHFKPLFANRACAAGLGYETPTQLVELGTLAEILPSHEQRRLRDLAAACLRGEAAPPRCEVEAVRQDGTTIWTEWSFGVVTWAGRPAIQSVIADIGERRRAETSMRESEEQFKALLDNSPQSLNLKDAEGRYLLVNPAWESQHAVSASEALGRTSYDVFGEETGESLAGTEREVLATGEARTFEATVVLPDGRRRTRLITKFPVRDRGGAIARIGTVGLDITERKAMEEALRDSEEKFHALTDNSPLTINLKDANGCFLMVNREFERHHGLPLAETVGKTARDLFGEESAGIIEAADAKVLATGATVSFEVDFPLADGGRVTHLATKFPIRDSRGVITRLGTMGMDITERKRMEQTILESEDRFREFAESSSDWLWETDADSRVTFVSDRITQLLGIEPAGIVGRRRQELAAPDDDANWPELERVVQARRPIRDFRYQIVDNAGQRRWLSISGKPRYSPGGVFAGYRGTGTDITEKMLALHREAQVRERFLAAIETVPVAVALFDEKDRLVVANERYRALLTVSVSVRPGMSFEELLRAEVAAESIVEAATEREAWIRERIARHRHPAGDFEIHRANGWYQVREHRTGDGYTLVVVHDVTDRKKAEEGLMAARDQLEARVRERTLALEQEIVERQYAEKALQQANQELERRVEARTRHLRDEIAERKKLEAQFLQAQKMEAIGQLAGGIAHDFNNLLTVIQGNLSWLSDRLESEDETVSQLMGMALEAARRAGELTHRMLAFSRRQDLRPERVDLRRVLDSVVPLISRALSESVTVEIAVETGTWPLMVDPHQLENAILNIAINARDAMPHGGTFTLKAENRVVDAAQAARQERPEAGEYVCLALRDTGTGMSPEVLARVFDPFFTTKDVGKGSGLGLSMVFGFANQSGGFVEIASEEGRGTSVELYLPRCPPEQAATAGSGAAAHEPPVSADGLTVLVVEDDPLVRGVAMEYLKMAGFQTVQAEEGRAAIHLLERTAPVDLVLSDIILPGGMSGLDLAERIRAKWPETVVLLMSGYSHDEFSRRGIDPEDLSLLRKPFTKYELLRKIKETMAEQTGEA